jgi:hypothetical protein
MIGWRYHLISIVAVFLALGLGLLMGTALLNDRLVENLRARTESLQEQLDRQEQELGRLRAFASQVLPFSTEGRLLGQEVVVVTHEDVDEGALVDAERALALAGADVRATLAVRSGMTAPSPAEQAVLSELLGLAPGTTPETIASAATGALAERLTTGPDPTAPEADDLLARLLSEGFVVAGSELDSTVGVGGQDQALVFVAGEPVGSAPRALDSLMPLIEEVARRDTVMAVGERSTSTAGVVRAARREVQAIGPLVTIDDLELPAGGTALVLGLEAAILTGSGGHYGIAEDADQLLPAAA